ncbi:PREDICTED: MATH domain and coiled-coil domain-containing protein At2g42475-like [Camelina sativa]|uniref:MATH domain and coiled-coil domain-containing protein At2g42475-like n=1 Tax=Camelina sativa TaxID=90675 RepID=A0ABM0Z051_CAMSA|nr:PREDICTED: MATH domain and coiled-coil domain-containing protein At2g42475-like [Camelina sativa]
MEKNHQKTSFTFEIDNFSEKTDVISSPIFISGGCEWFVRVHPKRYLNKDHVSVYLHVANPESLQPGWKRRANHAFIMLNQSGKELKRTSEACDLFCNEVPAWGYPKVLPVSKLKEEEFLENDKLIIKVELQVVEVVHKGNTSGTEMLDINGFQVPYTQVSSVSWMFAEHPDIAVDFKPKSQLVRTAYMNVLLSLMEKLNKPPQSLSVADLINAYNDLSKLTEAGFKLDWLKTKLDKLSLKREKEKEKADADGSHVQQLEERVKNPELMELKLKLDYLQTKLEEVSLERGKAEDADRSRVQQLEERVKDFELMGIDSKLDCLKSNLQELSSERKESYYANKSRVILTEERVKNLELMELDVKLEGLTTKLEEVSLERKKSDDANGSVVKQLAERVKNIELMQLDFKQDLKSKLDEVSLERKKTDDAIESVVTQLKERIKNRELMELNHKVDVKSKLEHTYLARKKTDDAYTSRVQQLEECVKNLELMVLDLKVEVDKEKAKFCDDDFLLVNEFGSSD